MNQTIGTPRDMCMIHEIHSDIQQNYKGEFPLEEKTATDICTNCRKMKQLPKFYRKLGGLK